MLKSKSSCMSLLIHIFVKLSLRSSDLCLESTSCDTSSPLTLPICGTLKHCFLFFSQVFPVRRAVSPPALPLRCQTLPVSGLWEEVRPQRPPVEAHQSTPFPTQQPDSSHSKLTLGSLGPLGSISCGLRPLEHGASGNTHFLLFICALVSLMMWVAACLGFCLSSPRLS